MQVDSERTLRRSLFRRLFGRPATRVPADAGCWTYRDGVIEIDLARAPELATPGRALRFEGHRLPERVLVIRGDDGEFHAFRNVCLHMGRRLDPVPGAGTVQCCSMGRATYGYDGEVLRGPAAGPAGVREVEQRNGKLIVRLVQG